MARVAKTTKTSKPAATVRKPGRPAAPAVKASAKAATPAKPVRSAPAPKRAPEPAAPKLSKEEMRVQLEKFERANATLRAKARESNRTAKAAAARINELEILVAQLEQQQAAPPPAATPAKAKAAAGRRPKQRREVDPGDAVPPGVAVETPEPMDAEAEAALENLEQNLHGE